jgi:hypothetical protein
MPHAPEWHGTQTEGFALQEALRAWCNCEFNPNDGMRTSTCAGHKMFAEDQRALDGLVFARRMANCLIREEFSA